MIRYFEWNFDTKIVTEFVREGECNGCGQCCMAKIKYSVAGRQGVESAEPGAPLGNSTDQTGVWYEVQDGEHRRYMRHLEITPDSRCSELTDENRCRVHDMKDWFKDQLALCDTWPIHPDQVAAFDQCSYSFTKLAEWTFDEIGYTKEN